MYELVKFGFLAIVTGLCCLVFHGMFGWNGVFTLLGLLIWGELREINSKMNVKSLADKPHPTEEVRTC